MYTKQKVSTFRDRFSELVNESKKTTVALAKELHVSNQTVSAWKTGTRSPKEPTIIAIAKYFKVNVSWLMGFDVEKYTEEKTSMIPDLDTFKKIFLAMTPDDSATVMRIFEKTELAMKGKKEE